MMTTATMTVMPLSTMSQPRLVTNSSTNSGHVPPENALNKNQVMTEPMPPPMSANTKMDARMVRGFSNHPRRLRKAAETAMRMLVRHQYTDIGSERLVRRLVA